MEGERTGPVTGPIPVHVGVRRSTRRRMVQSTLFHQNPVTQESDCCKNEDRKRCYPNDDAIDDGDEECLPGIQYRKKKKKSNSRLQSKESTKVANENSPSSGTPKKKGNSARDKKISPCLMLEAKLTAEENSKRFAGKQIHPFFSSKKAEKLNQDSSRLQNKIFAHREIYKLHTIGPIHVFEKEQDDETIIDWKDWKFLDQSLPSYLHCEAFDMQPHSAANKETSSQLSSVSGVVILNEYAKKKSFRIKPCNIDDPHEPDKKLWSEKYQPRKAVDVCGNVESVKYLREWLQSWHSYQSTTIADDKIYDSESDSEDIDNDTARQNVLLITGAVGSGKSAAIYACAKEQGFKILEISASDIRSGLVVKQKFGEALKSQFLEWSQEGPPEISEGPTKQKPLILFEDVDVVFPEDRGLTVAIKDVADKAKGPVILTSNSARPSLPDNLKRREIFFTVPTVKDLLATLQLVCAAEKAKVDRSTLERIARQSKGDIRKAVTELQFWCLGIHFTEDAHFQVPFSCSVESAHKMLPKIMQWSFPSPLSEHIDDELTKCLASVDYDSSQKPLEQSAIDAKKDAMLVLSCPEIEYADLLDNIDCFTSESSKKSRRNRQVVLSDSDDEIVDLTDCSFGQMGALQTSDSLFESRNDDVSCVPGSTVVPESETDNVTHSDEEENTWHGDYDRGFAGNEVDLPETSPEEVEDSQCVRVGSVRPEIQWLDQCSRVDFNVKRFDVPSTCPSVGEKWRKLIRNCGEMRSLFALESKDACRIVELASNFSDFISDVELLDDSVQTAAFWESGLRFYSETSNLGFDLEELTSDCGHVVEDISKQTKEFLKCMVPLGACMYLKGGALHEYMSSLRCILKAESCCVEERANGLRPRRRRRHYLRSFLSQEEISDLNKCNQWGGK